MSKSVLYKEPPYLAGYDKHGRAVWEMVDSDDQGWRSYDKINWTAWNRHQPAPNCAIEVDIEKSDEIAARQKG